MLRSLLAPLRHLQDQPHETAPDNNGETDASESAESRLLTAQVQSVVDVLKLTDDGHSRITTLRSLQSILEQNPMTLDAFREADGFLVLMHVLSTLPPATPSALTNPQSTQEVLDCMQLVFMVTSKALSGHSDNLTFFQNYVGYTALSDACEGLLRHPITFEKVLGCLLSLSFDEFALVDMFATLQASCPGLSELDIHFLEYAPSLGTIHLPYVFRVLWDFAVGSFATNTSLRLIVYKILEHLTHSSHRNLAILSMLGILTPLFSRFMTTTADQQGSNAADRRLQCKVIKRLLEMGASTQNTQQLLQCAVKEDKSLDAEMIDLIRTGLKSKWPPQITFQDTSSVTMPLGNLATLPPAGFTFMLWAWFERMPSETSRIFSISLGSRCAVALTVGSNGVLALKNGARQDLAILSKSRMVTSRWTHVTLVYYPHRTSQPAVRVFIDGVLADSLDWAYPRIHENRVGEFTLGNNTPDQTSSWCIASAYLLSSPLDDELPKFVYHLGPRYEGNFQDKALVRFLTYEASTSLNMKMVGLGSTSGETSLKKAIRDGILVNEDSILCKLVPKDLPDFLPLGTYPRSGTPDKSDLTIVGPLLAVPCRPLDLSLWSIGGAQLTLRLVSLAETPHELSRTISILCESLRHCWQNSEDMERMAGYDALASILHHKSRLVNMTSFEILFEFLGLSFRSPDVSAVNNTIAYSTIALDFELWSMTTPDIQRAHLEHFAFLLRASRYRKFNAKTRLSKCNVVRKLLFALQSSWYPLETVPHVISALGVVMQANFSANDAIKPIASYIAGNITSETVSPPSPRTSPIGSNSNEKVRQVLDAVISLFRIPSMYMKFAEVLPVARIALLWLGIDPSPGVACQILSIMSISLGISSSFGKRFELASGWLLLRKVLPPIWNDALHEAALDVLLHPNQGDNQSKAESKTVKFPQMLSVILVALRQGLLAVSDTDVQGPSKVVVEKMLGDLIDLHTSHSAFRQLFKSQSATEILVECLSSSPGNDDPKVSTQLTHLGLLVGMGNHVSSAQKQQILDITKPGSPRPSSPMSMPSSSRLASVQEETLRKSISHLEEWRNTITASERERYRKGFIDTRERRRRIATIREGILGGITERDVWPHLGPERTWRLDETEGPHRTRNKLEPFFETPSAIHHPETSSSTTMTAERDPEASSTLQTDGSIKDDTDGFSEDNGNALMDEIAEDKHRRVRHELEPGDIIEAVSTISRISGVDSYPGLLIFGRTHLYILDGLIENDVGELIDAVDAPKGLFFVAGSTPHLRTPQRARRWTLEQIAGFSNKSFLFRDVALEIFFKDSRTMLAVFLDGAHRHDISQRLQAIITRHSVPGHISTLGLVLREMSMMSKGRATSTSNDKALTTAQRQWQNREISNYAYLSILNQLSGRTPSDATQYPVFPWVLQDYTSDILDLSSLDSFRDLSKPMGALTPERCEIAQSRYTNLKSVGEMPFHYGTHFSSSMIVCHFLIRIAPFTNMFKTLQGGDWDIPDRLFIDMARTYLSASKDKRGDVRELIPEFFTCPEFLENLSHLDFGFSQTAGEKINDVKLPPWAKGDPLLFVHMHRQALESRHVSENLPAWIDLIWGCKQRDVDSLNVFHPLSYEGAIDLDNIKDPLEREATIGIIHNFGQTPRKLFSSPHPPRNLQGILSLPVHTPRGVPEDALALSRDPRPLKLTLDGPVACITKDDNGNVFPMPEGLLSPQSRPDEQIQWGKDGTLRVLHHATVLQTIEATSPTCAVFADQDTLVTGSSDSLVRVWRLNHAPPPTTSPFVGSTTSKSRKGHEPSLSLVYLLRKHSGPIICVSVSRAWSLAVSGSQDGSAILWDLNRGLYVRSIWHAGSSIETSAIHSIAINESTGYVATSSLGSLWLHTINARPIARLDLTTSVLGSPSPYVTSIAFHEREYSHLGILATGHADGSVALYTWSAEDTPQGSRAQWGFLKVRDLEAEKHASASVTCVKFVGETLWVGDSSGKVVRWVVPE